MKRVSFKVAKAIKESGYPQKGSWYYSPDGRIGDVEPDDVDFAAPTYLEVWLWLWREKNIPIDIEYLIDNKVVNFVLGERVFINGEYETDPEKAIIAAIKYLVDSNLIK